MGAPGRIAPETENLEGGPTTRVVTAWCRLRYRTIRRHCRIQTIRLREHGPADLHAGVGPDGQQVRVVRGVVQPAQREPVAHHRRAALLGVRDDVRRVEQLRVAQPAQRALPAVGLQDPLAELLLVEPLAHRAGHVAPPQLPFLAVRHGARERVRLRQLAARARSTAMMSGSFPRSSGTCLWTTVQSISGSSAK